MKSNNHKSAFSLVEISIVIIIIGILVAGVTQSSRLLNQAKLSSAKSMTLSSPVASIKGISIWIDSVSDASFQSNDLDDGTAITTWNDINPQTITKANLTPSGGPVYKTNIINGLPAVLFDGTDDFGSTANFSNLSDQATIFMVVKTPSVISGVSTIFSKRISASNSGTNIQANLGTSSAGEGWQLCDSVTSGGAQNCYDSGTSITVNNSYVMQMIYTANSSTGVNFFQNGNGGTQQDSSNNSLSTSVSDDFFLGKSGLTSAPAYFSGYLAELIIFDRSLKLEDRRAVEAYLGKKWGIAVAQ